MNAAQIERIWYSGAPVPWSLRALVPLYRLLRAVARLPYALGLRRARRLDAPVIVVGNLTAGGTGKTPLVIALVDSLRERGFHPGVISRGYGGKLRRPTLLDDHPDPLQVGDEPSLIRRRTRVPVAVARSRWHAGKLVLERRVDVIIADDGLQNPALARDIEICVIDGERRFGNGLLLPAGPLREPARGLDRFALRVCNGGSAQDGEFLMQLHGEVAVALDGATASRSLSSFAGGMVHAVAGIGNPARFFAGLCAHGIDVIEHALPDHHAITASDITFADQLPVLMTEKDAVKCVAFATGAHWCVPVRAQLDAGFHDAVADALRALRT